jgi:RNA polymerase sigma-70 factor (ECF subfamily)
MGPRQESRLLAQARKGVEAAFGELVGEHQMAVFNVAYRVLGNRQAAEDAAQEAFLRAFRALDGFDGQRPFAPWVKRICVNVCLNWLEAEGIRPQISATDMEQAEAASATVEQWADSRPTPEQAVLQMETVQQLRAAILQLPPHFRLVIELRHFQDLSYAEIAATLERPLSTIKSDLFRARKLLAEAMKQ